MNDLYIGSICGTSLDGIDVALVRFPTDSSVFVADYQSAPLSNKLADDMRAIVFDGKPCDALTLGQLDQKFGVAIAGAINTLIETNGLSTKEVTAIGSHGINLLHAPDAEVPVTLQIGDPNQIARLTGITTVADFRRRDVALGGQGAPLAPAFHNAVFADDSETRVVLNLGGIANITVLEPGQDVIGFDTGPANGLLDAWFVAHQKDLKNGDNFDRNGAWSGGGQVNEALLSSLSADHYFSRSAPKSTGKEYFNLAWLKEHLGSTASQSSAQDIQATLCELTAKTVVDSMAVWKHNLGRLLVCGGGAHNNDLIRRISDRLAPIPVESTESFGVAPDHVEAAAFAWLAKRTLAHQHGNLTSVTGASINSVLGGVYFA